MNETPQGGALPEITPVELKQRMDREQPIVLLDVRELFERQIADLPEYGQLHIPTGELHGRMQELDPDAPTVVYCRSGARSAWAVRMLMQSGFGNVLNLKGGILAWREDIDPTLPAY